MVNPLVIISSQNPDEIFFLTSHTPILKPIDNVPSTPSPADFKTLSGFCLVCCIWMANKKAQG